MSVLSVVIHPILNQSQRALTLITAIIEQYFYSGLILGWASIGKVAIQFVPCRCSLEGKLATKKTVYILKNEKVYGHDCDAANENFTDITDTRSSLGSTDTSEKMSGEP